MWKYSAHAAVINIILNLALFFFLLYCGVLTVSSVLMLLLSIGIFIFVWGVRSKL